MIELKSGASHLGLLPALGGSLSFCRIGGHELFVPTVDSNLAAQRGTPVAGYPLIPFSNRIGKGHFRFEGQDYKLAPNFGGDDNAIHGNAWERAWTVALHDVDRAILVLDHDPAKGDDPAQWPFAYRAVLSYVLTGDTLRVEMLVANRDTRSQPVGFGFHPFFARSDDLKLQFTAHGLWENGPDNLPTCCVPVQGERNFHGARLVGAVNIDNCYAGWQRRATLDYSDSGHRLEIEADAAFGHLVVFTAPDKPFVAVEAVSNMNDAINHPECLRNGLRVLAPGERMSGVISYKVVENLG